MRSNQKPNNLNQLLNNITTSLTRALKFIKYHLILAQLILQQMRHNIILTHKNIYIQYPILHKISLLLLCAAAVEVGTAVFF